MAWNRPTGPVKPVAKKPSAMRGIIAGLAVVILASLGTWYFLSGDNAPNPPREKPAKVAKPTKTKIRREAKPIVADTGNPKLDAKLKKIGEFDRTVAVEVSAAETPPDEFISKAQMQKPVFSSGVEQLMSIMFTCQPGNMPFPLVQIPKSDLDNLAAILVSKNEISEDDSDTVKRCKETVMQAKKEMIAYIKQGGAPDDFMAYYHGLLMKSFEYRCEAMRVAQETYEEDPELGREFVKKVNSQFDNEGIMPLSMKDISSGDEEDEEREVKNESTGQVN